MPNISEVPSYRASLGHRNELCFEATNDKDEQVDEVYGILEQAQAIPSLVVSGMGCVHQTNGHRRSLSSYCALLMDERGEMTRRISIAHLTPAKYAGNRRTHDDPAYIPSPLYEPESRRTDPLEIVELVRSMVWKNRGVFDRTQLVLAGKGRRILFSVKHIDHDHLILKILMHMHLTTSAQAPGRELDTLAEMGLDRFLKEDPTRSERAPDCAIFETVKMNSAAGIDEFAMAILTLMSLAMRYNLVHPSVHFRMENVRVTYLMARYQHVVTIELRFHRRMQHPAPFENHDKYRLENVACPPWRIALAQPNLVDREIEDDRMLPALSGSIPASRGAVQRTSMWDSIIA